MNRVRAWWQERRRRQSISTIRETFAWFGYPLDHLTDDEIEQAVIESGRVMAQATRGNEAAEHIRRTHNCDLLDAALDFQRRATIAEMRLKMWRASRRPASVRGVSPTGLTNEDVAFAEEIIDNAVPPLRQMDAPRTEVIRSIVKAIHEQGARLTGLPTPEPGPDARQEGELAERDRILRNLDRFTWFTKDQRAAVAACVFIGQPTEEEMASIRERVLHGDLQWLLDRGPAQPEGEPR